MTAQDADRLRPVLAETEAIIAGVKPDQMALPTPCPDYTVSQLVDHLTGWADNFAARVSGKEPANDPSSTPRRRRSCAESFALRRRQ